jgi:hypothetical protein
MDLHDEIAKVAYELFERDGGAHGKDREHWEEAERIVRARHAAAAQPQTEPPKRQAAPRPKKTAAKPAAGKAKPAARGAAKKSPGKGTAK